MSFWIGAYQEQWLLYNSRRLGFVLATEKYDEAAENSKCL
jgi:hypothetical protein